MTDSHSQAIFQIPQVGDIEVRQDKKCLLSLQIQIKQEIYGVYEIAG